MKIYNKPEKIYTFGEGTVAVGKGTNLQTNIPSITISKLAKPEKITTNLLDKEIEETELIILRFKNMEGFKVFKKMVDEVEKHLKENEL